MRSARERITHRIGYTRHGCLIDPADQTPELAAKKAMAAVHAGSSMILVGGSTDTDMKNVHDTVVAIKEALELVDWAMSQDADSEGTDEQTPVVLFPQGAASLSTAADAITFMMLMNSTDPKFLIGEQVRGAPFVKKAGIEPIPMGYLICEPGGQAGAVGRADLIGPEETEKAAAYAMAAECMGFALFYLEAGSGAERPVSPELISAVREACDMPIVVGGGIRDGSAARKASEAGADWVITGNLIEDYDDTNELQTVISDLIKEMRG